MKWLNGAMQRLDFDHRYAISGFLWNFKNEGFRGLGINIFHPR
jgi:hypothetical protein